MLQIFKCTECLERFTGVPVKNKTYPLKVILDTISISSKFPVELRLPITRKENHATRTAALVLPTAPNNKMRHEILQRFMLHQRSGGPALLLKDRELYFWRGWQVSKETVMDDPTAERTPAEANQTHREVLLQRMSVEDVVRQAELKPADTFRDSMLLKVDIPAKQSSARPPRQRTS